jgi:hypothetical protein
MINVIDKTCIYEGCKIRPAFNNEGETKALYCSKHKIEGMVNIKSHTCIHEGCKIQPVFNNKGETKALYCSKHKTERMVDVKNKTCIHEGCNIIPVFNKEGETKALYCSKHKTEGMINVKDKTCIYEGCKIQPAFNNKGNTKVLYCSKHKIEGMVNVKHETCKSYLCSTIVSEKYDGYCLYCYMNLFPDKPVSRNYKTKEYAVVEFVKTTFPDLSWISDKRIIDGCSKRRPDLFLDLGYQIIIIEVDENQHKYRDRQDELTRYDDLMMLHGGKFIFIRYNPDVFIDSEGKRRNPESATRLKELKTSILHSIKRIQEEDNDDLVEIENLFFDEI